MSVTLCLSVCWQVLIDDSLTELESGDFGEEVGAPFSSSSSHARILPLRLNQGEREYCDMSFLEYSSLPYLVHVLPDVEGYSLLSRIQLRAVKRQITFASSILPDIWLTDGSRLVPKPVEHFCHVNQIALQLNVGSSASRPVKLL